jgi:hypothetical protein
MQAQIKIKSRSRVKVTKPLSSVEAISAKIILSKYGYKMKINRFGYGSLYLHYHRIIN